MGPVEIASTLRQPAYIGENRCGPCTVVNVLLAALLAAPVAVLSPPLGAATLAGCLLAIYLRGYLVPGTPELTEEYLPPAVLRLFGKEPAPRTLGDPEEAGSWGSLEEAGIVEREGSVSLTADFRDRWRAAIHERRDAELGERAVARLLGEGEVAQRGDRAFSVDGTQLVRWDSSAALLADVAANELLRERYDDWSAFDRDARRELLGRLRLLLERCPDCDGATTGGSESVDPCCQKSYTVVWNECEACGALLGERSSVAGGADDELAALVDSSGPVPESDGGHV
ncbi:hypothetical protein [Halalkalicoccus tibetensis]|uniref:Restriction endonuclease n=1 Tax=Halalkalicoccus tibetensis TaxID=175632 RepID=A0ABD5UWU7_9EURY